MLSVEGRVDALSVLLCTTLSQSGVGASSVAEPAGWVSLHALHQKGPFISFHISTCPPADLKPTALPRREPWLRKLPADSDSRSVRLNMRLARSCSIALRLAPNTCRGGREQGRGGAGSVGWGSQRNGRSRLQARQEELG